jgi:hypothetical protein
VLLKILVVNDDWTDRVTDVGELLDDYRADVALVQEGKRQRYAEHLDVERFGVAQSPEGGSAVVWRLDRVHPIRDAEVRTLTPGQVEGYRVERRPIVWGLFTFRGRRAALGSAHRHPPRMRRARPLFDRALRAWFADLADEPRVIVGMDSNERGGLRGFMRGVYWHGHGIDGVLTRGRVAVVTVRPLKRRRSDHRPLLVFAWLRPGPDDDL